MENKRFNYIEFKIDVINNELSFLENYLLTHIDILDQNSLTNIKEKLTNLINKLTKIEQNYSVVKGLVNEVVEAVVKEEVKEVDILQSNEEIAYKVSQINYII